MSDVADWRHLRDRCRREKLGISELLYDGEEILPISKASGYFAYFDLLQFAKTNAKREVRAIGHLSRDGKKVRVFRYNTEHPFQRFHVETWPIDQFAHWNIASEMLIPAEGFFGALPKA